MESNKNSSYPKQFIIIGVECVKLKEIVYSIVMVNMIVIIESSISSHNIILYNIFSIM